MTSYIDAPFPSRNSKQPHVPFDPESYRGVDPRTGEPVRDKAFVQQIDLDMVGGLPDEIEACRQCLVSLFFRMDYLKVICHRAGVSSHIAHFVQGELLKMISSLCTSYRGDGSGGIQCNHDGSYRQFKPAPDAVKKVILSISHINSTFISWLQNELMPAVVAANSEQNYISTTPARLPEKMSEQKPKYRIEQAIGMAARDTEGKWTDTQICKECHISRQTFRNHSGPETHKRAKQTSARQPRVSDAGTLDDIRKGNIRDDE